MCGRYSLAPEQSKEIAQIVAEVQARFGAASIIVLAKNDIAKRFGIRTGQVLWEARQQCPGLVCVPAHYERYLAFSAQARDIYTSYTDQVDPYRGDISHQRHTCPASGRTKNDPQADDLGISQLQRQVETLWGQKVRIPW